VLVRVRAAGVNFADLMARQGLYPDAPELPSVLGYEVAGDVEAVGEGVEEIKAGDRVMAACRFGGYSEIVSARDRDVIALPDDWTYEEGAALPIVYGTAYAGLVSFGGLRAGERVLIQAAAGGVGIAATQIAKLLGAEIYGTASPSKHEAIRGFGVDHPVDYTRSGWEKNVPKVDLIMDAIGGPSFRTSYNLLNPGGRLIAFGASAVMSGDRRNLVTAAKAALRMPRFNLIKQMSESKAVIGLNALTLWDHAGTLEPWIAPISALLESGDVMPVVSDAVPFADAGEAHRILAERRNVGKVVLVP
jgi:NADPH:quinone reductase-like Zn-dependent oxidoreductase